MDSETDCLRRGRRCPGSLCLEGGLKGQSVQDYLLQTYQIFDDATRNIGKHDLKFGVMYIRYHENLYAPFREDGVVTFSTLSDFLTNNPFRASAPPNVAAIRAHNLVTNITRRIHSG